MVGSALADVVSPEEEPSATVDSGESAPEAVDGDTAQPDAASPEAADADAVQLSETQRNAIAMLNYLTVLTQQISASKNSRLAMEQAYSILVNNIYPNSVDSRTLSQLDGLLDTMEGYRMVDVKRERLDYIYEQNKAQAIRAAVPNPLGLIATVNSFRPAKLATTIAYMAVDSITSYNSYTSEADLQHLKDGWELDDEEAEILHETRKGIFSYMVNMVGEYDLPGDLTLTESAVDEFVKRKDDENVVGRIRFLESNRATYQSYGGYWLTLAQSYYENGDYEKCLEALDSYEALDVRIFRKDYDLAQVLPLAIAAADEVQDDAEFTDTAARYTQLLLDNTENTDWALRYFAAQTCVELYSKTQDDYWLRQAYDVSLDNINYLVGEQRELNATWLAPIVEAEAPEDATKEEKKQIKDYNASIRDTRKRELPPISEPLLLNCELLFALADELELTDAERAEVDGILHPNGEPIFLTQPLDARYSFDNSRQPPKAEELDISYDGTTLTLPADCTSADARITVRVKEQGTAVELMLWDWEVSKVERVDEEDVSSFTVTYASEEGKEHKWLPGARISIEFMPADGTGLEAYNFEYTTQGTKDEWYDYLKVWEGHKNNWYDYGKVWENSVVFERVQ